jgi:2,4-dienoyl-CoA reductase-like NADH-dependent reductase (Old Yellow Enzyme family)
MYPKINRLKDVAALRARLAELHLDLPLDDQILSAANGSPLAAPCDVGGFKVGNRWCIHPMEGWDANADGSPSPHTLRRWRNFGLSGAKLIWGGEAAAVQPDGRANPNQTLATPGNRAGLAALHEACVSAHQEAFGRTDDLLVGLQLTHSGRFSKPNDKHKSEPRIAYHHPLLDEKFKIDPRDERVVWTDSELEQLIERYVAAARLAADVGYQFVDVKACHGYLLHEFLSARSRPGPFGGELAGRSRVLLTIIDRVRAACPNLLIGVRLSAFDIVPYQTSREIGQPMPFNHLLPYQHGFGVNPERPLEMLLDETVLLLQQLKAAGVCMVNVSCGSPYYNPHIQRPAIFPPSDGYQPPEDPLVGVERQMHAVRKLRAAVPDLPLVGSGYSYLQDFLVHASQPAVRSGWVDFVGLGRMVLSYPELPADALGGKLLDRKRLCRTFSDCTTAPRNGILSGCYPLDPYYKAMPEAAAMKDLKQRLKADDE